MGLQDKTTVGLISDLDRIFQDIFKVTDDYYRAAAKAGVQTQISIQEVLLMLIYKELSEKHES